MTFTGTSNASSSGLQRTGSEISDSESPSWIPATSQLQLAHYQIEYAA